MATSIRHGIPNRRLASIILITTVVCFTAGVVISPMADVAWRKLFDSWRQPRAASRPQMEADSDAELSEWALLAKAESRLAEGAEHGRRSIEDLMAAKELLARIDARVGDDALLRQRCRFALAQTLESLAKAQRENESQYLAEAKSLYEQLAEEGLDSSATRIAQEAADRLNR